MKNFKRQRVWRDVFQSKPFLIFLGIIILFFSWSVFSFWNKMQDTEKNKKIVEDKITTLQQQKNKLTSDINSLNTDQGKERVFRQNFGLAKTGENEIVILDNNTPPPSLSTSPTSFWGFLKNIFK
jgi:cell division protein FtsL